MFRALGTFVYRMRYAVIVVMIALMAGLGIYGLGLGKHLSQSGWFDPGSQSSEGAQLADNTFGRDHQSDVILLITPPAGTKVDDPAFGAKIEKFVDDLIAAHPDVVNRSDPGLIDPYQQVADNALGRETLKQIREHTFDASREHAFLSIGIKGNDDTTVLNNFKKVEPFFDNIDERYGLPGTTFELAGLQPVASAMSNGMDEDVRRAEVIALPLVAVMLFFIFGGVIAACLPVLIGGLTIAGSLGIMTILAQITEINVFAQSVITLIGLGIAIDYGLFIVSRFREELAEGRSTPDAVRRTVMTSGQTVAFSATIIVAALACLLLFPQGFLKSVAYGAMFSVALAALLSVTVLPAILGILGKRIDMLGFKFLRRTKSREEIEHSFWGRWADLVMRHPLKFAIPTILLLLVLIIPFSGIKFGGITEKYLPPDNPTRLAQQHFDTYFPAERTNAVNLVIVYDPNNADDSAKLQSIADQANKVPGFTKQFSLADAKSQDNVVEMSAGLMNDDYAADAVKALRKIDTGGLRMYVTGTPALTQDSIDALIDDLPLMVALLILVSGVLMFLIFGSVVLPIKAALMSALGLGSTLGILTWIFIDGHGASIGNFTPGPLMSAVLVLIICIIFGLSTDYEVFLLSRMVEARARGASTTAAIREGTALTGRIITAAAAILVVVTGAFGLSDIVMMKYIAYGMIAALIIDATVIRMLLVPAVMKLLGDDCWWAPRWMKVIQQKIGLGETPLDDDDDREPAGRVLSQRAGALATVGAGAPGDFRVRATPEVTPARTVSAPAARKTTRAERRAASARQAGTPAVDQTSTDQGSPSQGSTEQGPAGAGAAPTTRFTAVRSDSGTGGENGTGGKNGDAAVTSLGRFGTGRGASTSGDRRAPRSAPDTGGWSLGESGIRLAALDAAESRTAAPQPAPSRGPTPSRRPAADARPVVEPDSPRPQAPRPEPTYQNHEQPRVTARPRPDEPLAAQRPDDRFDDDRFDGRRGGGPTGSRDDDLLRRRPTIGTSNDNRPLAASVNPEESHDPVPTDGRNGSRDGGESGRHDDTGLNRISVQDLLQRSRRRD